MHGIAAYTGGVARVAIVVPYLQSTTAAASASSGPSLPTLHHHRGCYRVRGGAAVLQPHSQLKCVPGSVSPSPTGATGTKQHGHHQGVSATHRHLSAGCGCGFISKQSGVLEVRFLIIIAAAVLATLFRLAFACHCAIIA